MKNFFTLLCLLAGIVVFAQADKDSLLKKDYNQILEKAKLMDYLDQKAMKVFCLVKEDRKAIEKDFEAFYNDSIVAGNPTNIDINSYLGYKKSKYPKNCEKLWQSVFKANGLELLSLTRKYGYLGFERIKFKISEGRNFHSIQYTLRLDEFDYAFNKLFDAEYKLGNMPEKDYASFLIFKNDNLTHEKREDLLNQAGIKMHYPNSKTNK